MSSELRWPRLPVMQIMACEPKPGTALGHLANRFFLSLAMAGMGATARRRLVQATRNVGGTQARVLRTILRENAFTDFGRAHGFSKISDWASYRAAVPVGDFQAFAPMIERQMAGHSNSLTASKPLYYARTSSSTGAAKDIPITHHGRAQVNEAQKQLALTLYRKTGFFDGRIMGIGGPPVEGTTSTGASFGSTTGHQYASSSSVIRSKLVIPVEVFSIADYDIKYLVLAIFGLLEADLTGIATANPSTILRLIELIGEERTAIQSVLAKQRAALERIPSDLQTEIMRRIDAVPDRIAHIPRHLDTGDQITVSDIWPRLSAIAVWTGASCGLAVERLRQLMAPETKVVEIGYRCSEFVGTINIDADTNVCVPNLHNIVFEFVERTQREADIFEFRTLEQLRVGYEYYPFITTQDGLYRYDVNDIVRMTGRFNDCPTLEFVQKGAGVTNITGEKISEQQVLTAVGHAFASLSLPTPFFVLLADEGRARYELIFEHSEQTAPCPAQLAGFSWE